MTTAPGWLWYDGSEILNNARTLSYLSANSTVCAMLRTHSDPSAACPEAAIVPGVVPWIGNQSSWGTPNYTNVVADPAPWYIPGIPESIDFLGYWVEEMTGLDGTHHQRSSNNKASRLGGVAFGPRRDGGRVITVSMMLVGNNQSGLDHGMRWLEDRLLGPLCDERCRDASMFVRTCCPPSYDYTYGFWELRNCTLTSGPQWSEAPEVGGCIVQRVEFTITAGDPCRYGAGETILADTPIAAGGCTCNVIGNFCSGLTGTRVCAVVERPLMGAKGLKIRVEGGATGSPRLKVATVDLEGATDCAEGIGLPVTRQVETREVNAGDTLLIDTGRQTVEIWPGGDSALARSAYDLLGYASGRGIDWPVVYTCNAIVFIEALGGSSGEVEYSVTIDAYQLEGCAAIYAESAVSGYDYGVMADPGA